MKSNLPKDKVLRLRCTDEDLRRLDYLAEVNSSNRSDVVRLLINSKYEMFVNDPKFEDAARRLVELNDELEKLRSLFS